MKFKKYEDLQFSDDFMFWKVMTEYEDICRRVVELCIGRKVSEIRYKSGQEAMKVTPESRGIRLDVYLEDDDTMYDIEMQTETKTFLGKRIRYYENVMDLNSLQTGAAYEELQDSYVVFSCLFDPFGENRVVYEFRRRERENPDLQLGDGTTEILINATGDASGCSEEMRQFLAAVKGESGTGGIAQDISDAVNRIRDHPQWRKEYMLFELKMRDAKQEGLEEGLAKGLKQGREEGHEDGLREGRAEERRASVDKMALYIMKEHPEMDHEEALKIASEILRS